MRDKKKQMTAEQLFVYADARADDGLGVRYRADPAAPAHRPAAHVRHPAPALQAALAGARAQPEEARWQLPAIAGRPLQESAVDGREPRALTALDLCVVNRTNVRKRWPNVPNLGDVRMIGVEPMSSVAASPVRTSALQAQAPELPGSVLISGVGFAVPFAWYDRDGRLWRTWQRCLIEGWAPFSATWPRSGMTRNGIAYRLPPLVPSTSETESGLLPTLCARDYRWGARPERTAKMRESSQRGLDLPSELRARGWNVAVPPGGAETFMGYPEGWTELEPSEMPSIRPSRKSSGAQS
jgi:hypothetical protein